MKTSDALSSASRRTLEVGAVMILLSLAACGGSSGGGSSAPVAQNPPPQPPPQTSTGEVPRAPIDHLSFSEIAVAAGINYVHGFRVEGPSELSVAGVAVGDYDDDGWLDLYIAQGDTGGNLLYRNQSQAGEFSFADVARSAGVRMTLDDMTCGPAFVDYDGDGDDDLFVGGVRYNPPRLFRNDGDGTFTDVTVASGLATLLRENNVSQAFGDYDQDGDLDMFIAHWTFTRGELPSGSPQHLWRNNGDGTFTDASEESMVGDIVLEGPEDFTFTPTFADIDNDGDLDLLVVADSGTSQVLINNGDQGGGLYTFSNVTDKGVITDEAGMGSAVADFDHDGDLDWFVSSISDEDSSFRTGNRYYENLGNGIFTDSTTSAGVRTGYWGWASCAADFNNDGHLDIFHVNGMSEADPSRLFIANGDKSFTEYSEPLGLIDNKQGRGVVCFDGDQDGDIDIFIANNGDTPSLFRNDGGNSLNYLNVKLDGVAPNTAALGARIYVASVGVTQMREITGGSNYVSQNPNEQHFGLNSTQTVDSIRIVWPDGTQTERDSIAANQRIRVAYPDAWSTD